MNGYKDGLAELGLPFEERMVVYGEFKRHGYEDQMARLFHKEPGYLFPDALVAASDVMAIDAMILLKRMGFRIPEDVAVTGFDNIPQAEIVSPTLTTISSEPERTGQIVVDMLLRRLDGKSEVEPLRVRLPGMLFLRESA